MDLPIGMYYNGSAKYLAQNIASAYGLLIVFTINDYYLQLYMPTNENPPYSAYVRSLTDSFTGEWIQIADYYINLINFVNDNYLHLTGGTVSGTIHYNANNLYLKNAGMFGTAASDTAGAQWGVNVYDSDYDNNNRRSIYFDSRALRNNIESCLRLGSRIDGAYTAYNLYGEHNITKGTTDLTAGTSSLNSGCIYLVYE